MLSIVCYHMGSEGLKVCQESGFSQEPVFWSSFGALDSRNRHVQKTEQMLIIQLLSRDILKLFHVPTQETSCEISSHREKLRCSYVLTVPTTKEHTIDSVVALSREHICYAVCLTFRKIL